MKRLIPVIMVITLMISVVAFSAVCASAAAVDELAETGLAVPHITGTVTNNSGLQVSWGKVNGVAKYRLFYREEDNISWSTFGDTAALTLAFTKVKANTGYYFTVRGLDKNGKYATSYEQPGYYAIYYQTPKPVSVKPIANGVNFSYRSVPGVKYYRIFYKKSGGSWQTYTDMEWGTCLISEDKLVSGINYSFTVRGISKTGKYITGYDTAGLSLYYVKCPILKVENTYKGQKLTYAKVSGAAKYRLFIWKNSKWNWLADTTGAYINTDVDDGKSYTYTIRALDKNGKYVSFCRAGVSLRFVKAPEFTHIYNAMEGWFLPSQNGYYKYRIFVKSGTSWKQVIDTYFDNNMGSVFWRYNTTLKDKQSYVFTIRAMDDDGKYVSGFNPTGWTSTFFNTERIELKAISNTASGVKLAWYQKEGVAKYRVFADAGSGWKKLGDTDKLSWLDQTAVNGKYYRYTVRGLDSSGKYCTYFDTEGLPIIYSTPAATTVDLTKAMNAISDYAEYLGYNIIGFNTEQGYRYNVRGTMYYYNTGDMTDLLIYQGKKWLKEQYAFAKAAGLQTPNIRVNVLEDTLTNGIELYYW